MLPLLHARSEEELHPTQSFAQLAAGCMIPLVLVCTVQCHAVRVQLYSTAVMQCTVQYSVQCHAVYSVQVPGADL